MAAFRHRHQNFPTARAGPLGNATPHDASPLPTGPHQRPRHLSLRVALCTPRLALRAGSIHRRGSRASPAVGRSPLGPAGGPVCRRHHRPPVAPHQARAHHGATAVLRVWGWIPPSGPTEYARSSRSKDSVVSSAARARADRQGCGDRPALAARPRRGSLAI